MAIRMTLKCYFPHQIGKCPKVWWSVGLTSPCYCLMPVLFDPEIPVLRVYPTDRISPVQNILSTMLLIEALFIMIRLKTNQLSYKSWYINNMENYATIKKNESFL